MALDETLTLDVGKGRRRPTLRFWQWSGSCVVLGRFLPREHGALLAGARMMVGLDSGLTHLAAALGRPTIGIYRASTPVRTPLVGSNYTASLGDRGASPSREAVMAAVEQALAAD